MKKKGLLLLLAKAGLALNAIHQLAVETRFVQRQRKINAVDFLVGLIAESLQGCVSYNDLASAIKTQNGTLASRQAYQQKVNAAGLPFLAAVLATLLRVKTAMEPPLPFRRFNRIHIQDSTVIKLPDSLMPLFSGVGNAHKQVCNARIQLVYDLASGQFTHWSVDPYRKNDLLAAPELPLAAGDLILRDRGYFTVAECQRIDTGGACFISRYKHPNTLYDPNTGDELDLCRLLKTDQTLDRIVWIGKSHKLAVRLIATPVSPEVANRRRQKLRLETHGHNPGQTILFLQGWTIFFTNLTDCQITIDDFIDLYGLRWKIELIFKAWKSHLSFDKIHRVSHIQLCVILFARFIALTLFFEKLYIPLLQRMKPMERTIPSLLKLMRYISRNIEAIPLLINAVDGVRKGLIIVRQYCCYDQRKRKNAIDKEYDILTRLDNMVSLN